MHSFSTGDFLKSSLFLLRFLATSLSFSKAMELHREANKPDKFPEGGLKANLTVLGAFMAFACTFGQMSAFGTYQAWYASHQLQHLPASEIAWIGSLQFWVFFFSVSFNFVLFLLLVNHFTNSILIIRVLPSDTCTIHMDQTG